MNSIRKILYGIILLNIITVACSSKSTVENIVPPRDTTGVPSDGSILQVDDAVRLFMDRYSVPGLSVAITKKGKLVYAKGYGRADKESLARVTDSSLFRIASVSKPVTSVAIMKLVQEEKLTLDDKVFGEGAILGNDYGNFSSGNISRITVRHLLQHTAGGWTNDENDPMFTNPSLSAGELITYTLQNRPPENIPGEHYAYSNFGYCILGRIIEKITGKTYEEYVQTAILEPAGIKNMSVGGNTLADRKPNEVKYYGQEGEDPYIYNITRMDAHGGWIANATDLLRLMVRADGFSSVPDILDATIINAMVMPSAANQNYACGWSVNSSNNWWHGGSLPGTSSWLVRTSGEYNWVVLLNTRSGISTFTADLDQLVWKAINNPSTNWPEGEELY